MGLFSKLNFRAVHDAYCDVAAFNFLTEVICEAYTTYGYAKTSVPVLKVMGDAAKIQAESLSSVTGGEGFDYSAALSRLRYVSDSLSRQSIRQLGHDCDLDELIDFCRESNKSIFAKICQAIHNGYLNLSAADALTLAKASEERISRAFASTYKKP